MNSKKTIPLSARLSAAAELLSDGVRLCDVGCDHAYLPIALCLQRKIPSAIGLDLRSGPLLAAAEHVRAAGLSECIDLRLSDGLQALRPGEADAVLITGLGGRTICRILQSAPMALTDFQELILGPQSEIEQVRRLLYQLQCRIAEERMLTEEGKAYVLLRAVPGQGTLQPLEAAYGPCLLRKKDPVLHDWLQRRQKQIASIREQMGAASDSHALRTQELEREEQQIEAALQRYEM